MPSCSKPGDRLARFFITALRNELLAPLKSLRESIKSPKYMVAGRIVRMAGQPAGDLRFRFLALAGGIQGAGRLDGDVALALARLWPCSYARAADSNLRCAHQDVAFEDEAHRPISAPPSAWRGSRSRLLPASWRPSPFRPGPVAPVHCRDRGPAPSSDLQRRLLRFSASGGRRPCAVARSPTSATCRPACCSCRGRLRCIVGCQLGLAQRHRAVPGLVGLAACSLRARLSALGACLVRR